MNENIRHLPAGAITIDVEDWFHILDTPAVPDISKWDSFESRVAQNMNRILDLFAEQGVRATFFWLGWVAERHPQLVLRCIHEGHEIASHGYGHVLAYQVGQEAFRDDIRRGKQILEDITGYPVAGFRAAGFGITGDAAWAFNEVRAAGYRYDSSVFPGNRAHGGLPSARLEAHEITTTSGDLVEFPASILPVMGRRLSLFGGGYLRLFPMWLIRWGITRLDRTGRPVIVYAHPREVDPDHPRLPLGPLRRFKSYVGLKSTLPKLRNLCRELELQTLGQMADRILKEHSGGHSTRP